MHACVQFEVCLSARTTLKSTLIGHNITGNVYYSCIIIVLQRELGHSKYTTLDKKIRSLNADLSGLNVSTHTDSSNYSYRLDRNNVDPDTENVELASETIRYQALTNSITSDFTRMQAVLK